MALTGELLRKAYEMAFFIHADEAIATRIVVGAAAKLEVAVSAQNKRLYYHPVRAALSNIVEPVIFRRKIWSSDSHLLQRLIYIESEFYEKLKEQCETPPDEEDLAVHFIKHLVRITFKRNSFYVALGLCRLLYNYSTAETMNIYNAVVQDPERVKDDYYYRSRKGILMSELKSRFGDLIRTYKGPRGEERFVNPDEPGQGAELVKECLTFFTPWATPCLVPNMFDPILGEISGLTTQDVREEHRAEANRVHALTHPICYQRLIRALGFQSPDEKLALPRFFQRNDREGPRSRRRPPPEFDPQKLTAIRGELAVAALGRKKSAAGLLRVLVDGGERARFDPQRDEQIRFSISRDAELLEIIGVESQDELLLATMLLNPDMKLNELPNSRYAIVLEAGQEISIRVLPAAGTGEARMIDVTYRTNSPGRAAKRLQRRLAHSLTALAPRRSSRFAPVMISMLALLLIGVGLIGLRQYWKRGSSLPQASAPRITGPPAPGIPPERNSATAATPNVSPETRQRKTSERSNQVQPETVAKASPPPRPAATEPMVGTSEQTRAPKVIVPGMSLLAVKNVFVEPLGDTAESKLVAGEMVNVLRTSGKFNIATARDEADAVLKISVREEPSKVAARYSQVSVNAMLVNVNGEVLWPLKSRHRRSSYSGPPKNVVRDILRNLLREIERSRRR